MSYTPTEWNTGDTIEAAALNNIESGIEAVNIFPSVSISITFGAYDEDASVYPISSSEVTGITNEQLQSLEPGNSIILTFSETYPDDSPITHSVMASVIGIGQHSVRAIAFETVAYYNGTNRTFTVIQLQDDADTGVTTVGNVIYT